MNTRELKSLAPAASEPGWETCARLDAREGRVCLLSGLWPALRRRESRVLSGFSSEDRAYLVVGSEDEPPPRMPRTCQALDVLERVLLGSSSKAVSIDLDVSQSTVAATGQRALEAVGSSGPISSAPLLLVLAVHAALTPGFRCAARSTPFEAEGRQLTLFSAPRPDRCLRRLLSRAEFSVAQLLIEGKSHCQISEIRGKSSRTVANQLGATFRKLNVSGRAELLFRSISLQTE